MNQKRAEVGGPVQKLSFETSKLDKKKTRRAGPSNPLSIILDLKIEVLTWLGINCARKKDSVALKQHLFCAVLALMIFFGLIASETVRQSRQEYRAAMSFRFQKAIRKDAPKDHIKISSKILKVEGKSARLTGAQPES